MSDHIIPGCDPGAPLTMAEVARYVEFAQATMARLRSDNEGLHEQVERLEAEIADLQDWCLYLHDTMKGWREWHDQNAAMYNELPERNRELEGEVLLLRRRRGSGVGRGRQPEWTQAQAAEVRKRRDAGMSLRRIADETRLTLAQVRTILKPRPRTTNRSRSSPVAQLPGGTAGRWRLFRLYRCR